MLLNARLSRCLMLGAAALCACTRGAATHASGDGDFTTSDGTRLHYRVAGSGGDTIVAIHGGPGVDLESIAGDFAPLAAKHTVIFYDQRGTGRSELPTDTTRLGARQQIDDLEAVRRHFRLDRLTLVAHSYGPLLAASYALAHPTRVRRMVFFGPVPPYRGDFWTRFAAAADARFDSATRARLRDAGRRLADSTADTIAIRAACRDYWAAALRPRLGDPTRAAALRSDLCASNPRGIRYGLMTTNRVVMGSYGNWDLRPALRTLSVPTLIFHGEAEAIPMDLAEAWVKAMANARLVRVRGAAHFAYAENPDFVWPEVERFLTEP